MNALHRDKRTQRTTAPSVECLDLRIAPTTLNVAMAAAVSSTHETRIERLSARRLERRELAIERHEVRLARLDARSGAHSNTAAGVAAQTATLVSVNNLGNAASSTSSTVSAAAGPSAPSPISTPSPVATTPVGGTGSSGSQGSTTLPATVDQALMTIYQEYEQNPTGFSGNTSSANGANLVVIQGDDVGIQVHDGNPADFAALVTELQNAGMQITTADAAYGTVVGLLPIAQLPTVAGLSQAPSVTALMQPILN